MTDWDKVINDLAEMREYFVGCYNNAGKDSAARDKFAGYVSTLIDAIVIIKEATKAEDDGK